MNGLDNNIEIFTDFKSYFPDLTCLDSVSMTSSQTQSPLLVCSTGCSRFNSNKDKW